MSLAQPKKSARSGFTLPEILVAVAMVGVLSAVVLPTVIGQMSKGEVSRVVQELQSADNASQMFRNDIGKYPASIAHLVASTGLNSANALTGTGTYPSNAVTLWQGPYLARGDVTGGLKTPVGTIALVLENRDWDGDAPTTANFVVFAVTGLTDTRKALIDLAVDGAAGSSLDNETHGKIRYVGGGTLYYFTSPVN